MNPNAAISSFPQALSSVQTKFFDFLSYFNTNHFSDEKKLIPENSASFYNAHIDSINSDFSRYLIDIMQDSKLSCVDIARNKTKERDALTAPRSLEASWKKMLSLENGWLDGEGQAPTAEGIEWLASMFKAHYPNAAPVPYAYPTVEGNIQVEWSLGAREITLEVDIETKKGFWHELNVETNSEYENDFDVNTQENWDWIMGKIEARE